MKIIFNLFVILCALQLLSFKNKDQSKRELNLGTYGVCNCGDESSQRIGLSLKEDSTFCYFDNNDQNNIINVKGVWKLKGNTILLSGYQSKKSICNRWQIDVNENCIKSRKGVLFLRLCNIEKCN